MRDEDILKKAIEKATKNGWKNPFHTVEFQLSDKVWGSAIPAIIFSHDFAKAFWNKNEYGWTKELVEETKRLHPKSRIAEWGTLDTDYNWQYHLQQMVLEENPLQYLKKYI